MDKSNNDMNFEELVKCISEMTARTPTPIRKNNSTESPQIKEITEEIIEGGLTNTEVLKLINDTFGTNYTSINTYDLLEAISKEWNKL